MTGEALSDEQRQEEAAVKQLRSTKFRESSGQGNHALIDFLMLIDSNNMLPDQYQTLGETKAEETATEQKKVYGGFVSGGSFVLGAREEDDKKDSDSDSDSSDEYAFLRVWIFIRERY